MLDEKLCRIRKSISLAWNALTREMSELKKLSVRVGAGTPDINLFESEKEWESYKDSLIDAGNPYSLPNPQGANYCPLHIPISRCEIHYPCIVITTKTSMMAQFIHHFVHVEDLTGATKTVGGNGV